MEAAAQPFQLGTGAAVQQLVAYLNDDAAQDGFIYLGGNDDFFIDQSGHELGYAANLLLVQLHR